MISDIIQASEQGSTVNQRNKGCTPLFNRVRPHLAWQCLEIDDLAAIPVLSKCKKKKKKKHKNVEKGVMLMYSSFISDVLLFVAVSTSCHRKSKISMKF